MTKFISFDIKIGSATKNPIKESRIAFHNKVIQLLFPKDTIDRTGMPVTSPLSYFDHGNRPQVIQDIISNGLSGLNHTHEERNICLIDLTSNDQYLLREHLLEEIYKYFISSCKSNLCNYFIILARDNFGDKSASEHQREAYLKNELKDYEYTLLLIVDSGDLTITSSISPSIPNIKKNYCEIVKELEGDISDSLENRCIRRLGHFRTRYRDGKSKCRQFSYLLHEDSEKYFKIKINDWWHENKRKEKYILYDLKNNEPFRNALQAWCMSLNERDEVKCYRIESILEKDDNQSRKILTELSEAASCLLILDAVETGDTLREYIALLRNHHINISKDVLAAINRTGTGKARIADYTIHGFIEQQPEIPSPTCIQCKLELPFDSDYKETFLRIRTFDMLYMANHVGYGSEEDVPDHGEAYRLLPKFEEMLGQFGDWIAYKLLSLLGSGVLPEQFFIIYPEQTQSSAMVDKMKRLSPPTIEFDLIPIPNDMLKEKIKSGSDWSKILESHSDNPLKMQLESNAGKNNALILDIFMGSGLTAATIENLLSIFAIKPFAYICLVDFAPSTFRFASNTIKKLSIYEWFNPRKIKTN